MHDNLDQVRQVFPNAHVAAGSQPDTQCGGAARARARPRLDLWTHTVPDEPCLELTVRLCGKGNAESAAVILSKPRSPSRSGRRKDPEDCSRENMDSTVQERSVRRAKKNIRLSAKVMGADRLLTLTSRKYLYTLDRFWEAFNEFNRLMRKRFGNRWQYVAVPELHPKAQDHYHGHLAIRGHYNVHSVRVIWRTALRNCFESAWSDHTPGNIDIDYKGHQAWRVCAVAKYISKYLAKDLSGHGEKYRKRYERSRGLNPEVVRVYCPLGVTDLDIIRKVQEITGGVLARNPRWEVYGGHDCMLIETEAPGRNQGGGEAASA